MRVVALVPAFNEATRIAATVSGLGEIQTIGRVVVVDDGSTDETAAVAARAGAEVVLLNQNHGKGAALDSGLQHIGDSFDVLLLIDADLEKAAAEADKLLQPVLSGNADMTIATFPRPPIKGGFGLVKGTARIGIRLLGGGFEAQAPLSGQRALTARAVQAVAPFAFGYGVEVALTVRALRAGLRVAEVPTTMSHAATGRDIGGFMHRGRQFVHVCLALARLAVETRKTS